MVIGVWYDGIEGVIEEVGGNDSKVIINYYLKIK